MWFSPIAETRPVQSGVGELRGAQGSSETGQLRSRCDITSCKGHFKHHISSKLGRRAHGFGAVIERVGVTSNSVIKRI